MKLKFHPFRLELKQPFSIAHGTFHYRDTLIVEIEKENFTGLGEATAISYYGKTISGFLEVLQQKKSSLENLSWEYPADLWEQMQPILPNYTFLQCALDIAAYDWWSKKQNLPLYQALGLRLHDSLPLSNYTLPIAAPEQLVDAIRQNPAPVYKIKLGKKDDWQGVKALRQATDAIFRIDANGSWTLSRLLTLAPRLKELGVEYIEQPLPPGSREEMKIAFRECPLPLIADESCQTIADVKECAGYFHGVNIKLMKCGGITPALNMINEARSLKMKIMVGCMTESSVGISAIAHLLPLLDYVDMDGALLLKNDPAGGVILENGQTVFRPTPGTGAFLNFSE